MQDYSGTDTFPTAVQLIEDSDSPNATNFGVLGEGALDRTIWLRNRLGQLVTTTYTASNPSVTVPANVVAMICEGYGGGGGGGGSSPSQSTTNRWQGGGAGGGGALLSSYTIAVTPGAVFAVTIGAGGAGGAADTKGTDGGDSEISISGPGTVVRFAGAQGGQKGSRATVVSDYGFALGGAPVRGSQADNTAMIADVIASDPFAWIFGAASQGGAGTTSNTGSRRHGNPSPQGLAGGAPGTGSSADDDGSYRAGGPGGGGGGGPKIESPGNSGALGGAGGNGGDASNGGTGTSGGNGQAADTASGTTNTGAGGGGAGGPGEGGTGGAAGAGGAGSAGLIRVTWVVGGNL